MFVDIRRYADLAAEDDRILELGCGTGRATLHMAEWPHAITALEPADAMADIARLHLAPYENVDVITTRFEDWPLERGAFGLVITAQAYHWLDAATRIDRIADALYAHGSVAIARNEQFTPSDDLPFFERVQRVYLDIAPHIAHRGAFRSPDDEIPHPLAGSARFVDLEQFVHDWHWTLNAEDYVGLLGTHSNHAALDEDTRGRLHEAIGDLVEREFGGTVTEHHRAVASMGRRATSG